MTSAGSASPVAAGHGPPAARSGRSRLSAWQETILLVGLALVLAVLVKTFLLQGFYIPSNSMADTLVRGDRIVVPKVTSWGGGGPHRGDVVVFADPGGWLTAPEAASSGGLARVGEALGVYPGGGHLVKRVIGVAGDEVACCDSRGRVTVNGTALDEQSYLSRGERPSLTDFDIRVRPGHLWVQGDNRSHSADSRAHLGDPGGGQVPLDDVVGPVLAIVWPPRHAATLSAPATFAAVR